MAADWRRVDCSSGGCPPFEDCHPQAVGSCSQRIATRTVFPWDDALVESQFFRRISNWPPLVPLANVVPVILSAHPSLLTTASRVMDIAVIAVVLLIFNSLVDAGTQIYSQFEVSRRVPLPGFAQVLKLVVISAAIIYDALSILLGKEPWVLLSGIGALTAILLLVFKDPILGFVGGIQLIANDLLRPGDWIEMEK